MVWDKRGRKEFKKRIEMVESVGRDMEQERRRKK